MPRQTGALTNGERVFAERFAATGDKAYAAKDYAQPYVGAHKNLAKPAVLAEIAKKQQELIFSELLPLAVAAHKRILSDPKSPAGAVVQAVKLAYDRTLGSDDAAKAKEPHEMTPEELATAINALEKVAAERAKPVANNSQQADIFS